MADQVAANNKSLTNAVSEGIDANAELAKAELARQLCEAGAASGHRGRRLDARTRTKVAAIRAGGQEESMSGSQRRKACSHCGRAP
jgi:hypothetical protein